jgi:stage II sporulation protein AA (anti-sigma F factor antagonist)
VKHPFELRVDRSQGATRIALAGEVDIAVQETVRDAVSDALSERPAPELVIDLREVTFMDSSGISVAVIETLRAAEAVGVRLHLESGGIVRDKLRRIGVDQFMPAAE